VLGRAAYPLTALALLPGHRPFTARLRIGEEVHELVTHQLNIANGSHHAGRAIAPDTGLDDRELSRHDGDRSGLCMGSGSSGHFEDPSAVDR